MPTYVYRREYGSTFEYQQSIKEDALTVCPTTGQAVTRVIASGTGLIFKGSGFYLTDYARNSGSPSKPSGDSATKESGAKDSRPAAKPGDTTKD